MSKQLYADIPPIDTPDEDIPPVPICDDLRRLAISMANVLKRRYPNPSERKVVQVQIMQQIEAKAA